MMRTLTVISSLWMLALGGFASGQEIEPEIAARIAEIESYEPATGTWEGTFEVTSAPPTLRAHLEDIGAARDGVGIRVALRDDADPSVWTRYPGDDDWHLMNGELTYLGTQLGWQIIIQFADGLWIEKYSITFDRVEERKADLTFTRTVHNWYVPAPDPEFVQFYHMFGVGSVTKRASGRVSSE